MAQRPRVEARRTGKVRYIGKPCRCGCTERYTSTGVCVKCIKIQHSARRHTDKYKIAHRDAQRVRNAQLRGYAAPPREIDCPPRPLHGNCESCGTHVGRDNLRLDHDHKTGAFLGWCCDGCNSGIGLASDAAKCRMRAAYLERSTHATRFLRAA